MLFWSNIMHIYSICLCKCTHRYLHTTVCRVFMETVGSPSADVSKALGPSVFDALCVCVRVCVRVCIFQELTEEGIPFLILFHIKEDRESLDLFQQEVARQLISEKGVCLCHFVPVRDLNFS